MSIDEQILVDKKGKTVAVQIPINQNKKMLEIMEDIRAYKKVNACLLNRHLLRWKLKINNLQCINWLLRNAGMIISNRQQY